MKSIKINIQSDRPITSRLAWWFATYLPQSIQEAVVMRVLGGAGAVAEKGLDATLNEVLQDVLALRETPEWSKPTKVAMAHNNLNHCNAEGCDGVKCSPDSDHTKGDF